MESYININALDIDFIGAERGAITFEDWANQNELCFTVTELDGMDENLHLGTHMVNMYVGESYLTHAYGYGSLEALINLAKGSTGTTWSVGGNTIKAPMKFKGL